jgi:hypothetical protein
VSESIGATSSVAFKGFDETALFESSDRAVECARAQYDARERFDVLGERVAVLGPVRETRQDQ